MKQNELFFFQNEETESNFEKNEGPELIGCPHEGRNCKKQLAVINKHYLSSSKYQREKKYQLAIKFLKSAYYKADELQHSSCAKCIELFKATITDSMEDLHKELYKMTRGIFRNKRYTDVYAEAQNALKELNRNN